jgi:hypothetical protein
MMSFFYLGHFQMLILIEIPSLLILYLSAKWMLVRVCKQPRGLSLKLSNFAQSLMRFYVPLYWLGRLSLQFLTNEGPFDWDSLHNPFSIVTICVVGFMLVCEAFVAKVAMRITIVNAHDHPSASNLNDEETMNRTYEEANMFHKIHEEDLLKTVKLTFKKLNANEKGSSRRNLM